MYKSISDETVILIFFPDVCRVKDQIIHCFRRPEC